MTIQDLLSQTIHILGDHDDARFDAVCLIEDFARIPRGTIELQRESVVSETAKNAVIEAAQRRANGYPLQYLLGNWDFLDLTLSVGEGVLIPRPETELLCETAAAEIARFPKEKDPIVVWDLCGGSGCIGLGVSSLVGSRRLQVTEIELSDEALFYLQKNTKRYPQYFIRTVKADILLDFDRFTDGVDVILSNPPYIKTEDLATLQTEVQHEPMMALDGDRDGLRFYRAIADHWIPKLRSGGFAAVEIGIGQSEDVVALFPAAGLDTVTCLNDFAGIGRVVIGHKP